MDLFYSENQEIKLDLPDSDILFYPNFLSQKKASDLFTFLRTTITWKQDEIRVYGKNYPQPRLTYLFANNNLPYAYSNIKMYPSAFPEELLKIKDKIENSVETHFTSCLANLYRTGNDSNGWHADDEKELGQNPVIASLSLGGERWFHLKHKEDKQLKTKIELTHGSLLVMKGLTQHKWLHQIPKTKKEVQERINLTFRVIK